MQIDKVVIVCFKGDIHLLRPCIASVRYWYPDIEIYLLKDKFRGDFDTTEIEKHFSAKIDTPSRPNWGWGWAKLDPFINPVKDRYLVLDADTVMVGPVLSILNQHDDEFIVTGFASNDENNHIINAHYLKIQEVKAINTGYQYPGFGFNTGQMVVTSGILNQKDFEEVCTFDEDITCKYPNVFHYADQGVLNYILAFNRDRYDYSIKYENYWLWPAGDEALQLDIREIRSKNGYPLILHWAGIKR
ncbi:MAG: hypothetical protein H3C64_08045, partial [Candidatus Kuenenia stuttgartiensis]|nr:hypothetical protein [Candidatus Kuenenia stuttgartiensis]